MFTANTHYGLRSHLLNLLLFLDIEAQILEIQSKKATLVEEGQQGVGLDSTGFYDQEIYGGGDSRFVGYVTSIPANEQEEVSIFHPSCVSISIFGACLLQYVCCTWTGRVLLLGQDLTRSFFLFRTMKRILQQACWDRRSQDTMHLWQYLMPFHSQMSK